MAPNCELSPSHCYEIILQRHETSYSYMECVGHSKSIIMCALRKWNDHTNDAKFCTSCRRWRGNRSLLKVHRQNFVEIFNRPKNSGFLVLLLLLLLFLFFLLSSSKRFRMNAKCWIDDDVLCLFYESVGRSTVNLLRIRCALTRKHFIFLSVSLSFSPVSPYLSPSGQPSNERTWANSIAICQQC